MLSRSRSENRSLEDARQQTEQSRSELEQTLEAVEEQQAEAESLRREITRLRGEAQDVQPMERTHSLQSPSLGPATSVLSDSAQSAQALTDRNRALLEYIREPVDPSLNSDVRYAKEGVISAVEFAAQNAGVIVQRVEAEDSEYPCLVGAFCEPQDYAKPIGEIRRFAQEALAIIARLSIALTANAPKFVCHHWKSTNEANPKRT
jgi:hypothetical protein